MRLVSVDLDPVEIAADSAVNFLHCYSFRIDEKNGCKIFKYGCSRIFIERKCYRTYIWNFSKVRSTHHVGEAEIPAVEK